MFGRKAQTNGLITGIVFGVSSLIIAVIIAFVIVSTLNGAGLLEEGRALNQEVNETEGYINSSGYQLAAISDTFALGSFVVVARNTTDNTTIDATSYSVSNAGLIVSTTATIWNDTNFDYNYSNYSKEEQSQVDLTANFTSGVDNISEKVPTVLLVAAIVLILGILALLVTVWQKMRLSGGQGI